MSRIEFENGQIVEFDGIPTQQDVEEVSKNLNIGIKKLETKYDPYTTRVGKEYIKGAKNIVSGVQEAKNITFGKGIGALRGPGTGLLRVGGEISRQAFTPITEAPIIKQGLEGLGNVISNIPGAKFVAQKAQELSKKNPELAKDLQDLLDIATLGFGRTVEKPLEKGLLTAAEKTAGGTSGLLKGGAEKLYGVGVRMEEPTRIAVQSYQASKPTLIERIGGLISGNKQPLEKPITEAQTALRKGLVGTEWQLGVQAERTAKKIWNTNISPALQSIPNNAVNMRDFLSNIRKRIINETPELGRRNSLLEAFDAFSYDYRKVGNIGLEKLQQYKEGWAKTIPEATYKGKPIGSALKEVKNYAAQEARKNIYDKLGPEIKQAYIDYGNLQSIKEMGRKTADLLREKGITRQVWEAVLDIGITPISTIAGQVLYKTAKGIEFIGQRGARKIKDLIR